MFGADPMAKSITATAVSNADRKPPHRPSKNTCLYGESIIMTKYLTLVFVLVASAASAQQLSMSEKLALRDNCVQDIKTLCPGIKPGGGLLMDCIKSKKDQLSQPCADTITEIAAKRQN